MGQKLFNTFIGCLEAGKSKAQFGCENITTQCHKPWCTVKSFAKIIKIITNRKHPPCLFLHCQITKMHNHLEGCVGYTAHIRPREGKQREQVHRKQSRWWHLLSSLKELMQHQHFVTPAGKWAITSGFASWRFSAELPFPILALPK